MIDSKSFRKVLGQFPTGVTIITSKLGEQTYGFTANSFTSVSLDPPLVLFCMNKDSEGYPLISESKVFAVNLLSREQEELSNRFANPSMDMDQRYEGLDFQSAQTGCPILPGTLGFLDCRLHQLLDGGDHWILIGEVIDIEAQDGDPLLYFQGRYASVAK
ncbi:MAG: flavin reductase family protein [Bacteroidota bacterium]